MKLNPISMAVLAAALYAVSTPISKLLLSEIQPVFLASLLYLGAGIGMLILQLPERKQRTEHTLTQKDLPYTAGMVILDIAAPILMMLGLRSATAANASLLNNFEIVATSLIALIVFHERIGKRLWAAIALITAASMLLSLEGKDSLTFSAGSVLVLLACTAWGLENNCTRMISGSDPQEIVIIKGLGSGAGSAAIALLSGEAFPPLPLIIPALLLGFASYGLSVFFYVYAQRYLGAARTSAYYALSPFIGSALSFIMLRETPSAAFITALILMTAGAFLASGRDQQD